MPLFFIMYWLIFMIGTPLISQGFRYGVKNSLLKKSALPVFLLVLYYGYVWINGQTLFEGVSILIFYFIFFRILVFYHLTLDFLTITVIDYLVLILFFFTMMHLKLTD